MSDPIPANIVSRLMEWLQQRRQGNVTLHLPGDGTIRKATFEETVLAQPK